MRVSVICKNGEWQVERLKEAAVRFGVDLDIRDITQPGSVPENLGDVVLWRSSSLGGGSSRFEMMNMILKNHLLINRCLAHLPQSAEKVFQQQYVQNKTRTVNGIPTFTFQSIREIEAAIQQGILLFPFIQKPNKGSKGKGVELIRNSDDLNRVAKDVEKQVYQNFIRNSGDYRALILGGRILGAIKRTAREGGFLNNISQGGRAEPVTDPAVLKKLRRIGTTVASVFELALCGVDVIYDDTSKEYRFLEVNTVPQWKGFQEATAVDVAAEVIQYCQRIAKRKTLPTIDIVSEEYRSQIHLLGEKKFHFLSRLSLWTGDEFFKNELDTLKQGYIGSSTEDHRKRLAEIFAHTPKHGDRMIAKEARQKYFNKYPSLEPSLGLLFKHLFAKVLYGIDLRPYILELVSDADFISLKRAIENDKEAMQTLSTHAINYLSMLENYLGSDVTGVDPKKLLQIGMSYPVASFELQIYFFTHCIIGASRFYSSNIKGEQRNTYIKMLRFVEKIIQNHFREISLDNKFEFLVCTRICGYASDIETEILAEADRSLAPDGNYLIDTLNVTASPDERNDFVGSEHRNVLYLMAQTPRYPQ